MSMDTVPVSDASIKQFFDQQQSHSQLQSQSQQRLEASPKQSRTAHKLDLRYATNIHARRQPARVGHLDIDTQQPLPQHFQRTLCTGPCATKQTITTGTSIDGMRRRQWSQGMLDVLQDLSLVLSSDGIIVWAPRTAKALLGYEPEKLVNQRLADLIRPDEATHFAHHLQKSIDQQAEFYDYHHIRKADGGYSCLEVSGRPHYEEVMDPVSGVKMHVSRGFCLSARLHPSRAAHALDTFFDIGCTNVAHSLKMLEGYDLRKPGKS